MLDLTAELGCDDHAFLRGEPARASTVGRPVRLVDLFAGCGGLTLGAVEATAVHGHPARVVLAAEIDPVARAVYQTNFPDAEVDAEGDVNDLFDGALDEPSTMLERRTKKRVGAVDLLIGGPPCQGHSNLNNHTRSDDFRNALYLRMVRAAEVLEPTSIAIENVPGVRRDRGQVVDVAVKSLERLGYQVDEGVVNVARMGVPQLRFRHVLLASSRRAPSIDELIKAHLRASRPLSWAIADLVTAEGRSDFDTASAMSPDNLSRARWLLKHDEHDLPNRHRPACHRDKPDHRYKSMYGRLWWDQPAQTITTGFGSPGQGRYLHPSSPRTLTPHEAARVQFFPDWFSFEAAKKRTDLARCIGNAVPPKLGYALARYLLAVASRRALPTQFDASPVMSESRVEAVAAE